MEETSKKQQINFKCKKSQSSKLLRSKDFKKVIKMFSAFENGWFFGATRILQHITDAWNSFNKALLL